MYAKHVKRPLDFVLSLTALIILSPLLLILTFVGAIAMKGNPYFIQKRTGKEQKDFYLVKFRTMSNEKDEFGNLLPDNERTNSYGEFLRSVSFDELPELLNIIKGEMSFVGPRPLLPEYNIFFTTEELRRFNVKPGLIPPDSVDESPIISWTKQFEYECTYADNVCLKSDLNIILKTFKMLFARKKSHYGEFVRTPLNVEREKVVYSDK